jgi:hypothetical protein
LQEEEVLERMRREREKLEKELESKMIDKIRAERDRVEKDRLEREAAERRRREVGTNDEYYGDGMFEEEEEFWAKWATHFRRDLGQEWMSMGNQRSSQKNNNQMFLAYD